jgi:endonuclease/exonuclease/phosphatase family metal-dependent hydrolase
MRVLTWNLYHGRAEPPAGRDLLGGFAEQIASWEWDAALLQEVPPWWPGPLARASGAVARSALTSRNQLLAVRRFAAIRWPDLIKSGGGGANAILLRGHGGIAAHGARRLRLRPERRIVHAVRTGSGLWIANLHAQVRPHALARADIALARATVLRWAGDGPVVLGGDFNVRDPAMPGFGHSAWNSVDHVWARGLAKAAPGQRLERGALSDHAPVVATLADRDSRAGTLPSRREGL